ncbi:hypothetical protein HDU92_004991 [Lobulomyces angularis]|nr:hypothetical protein HDU92_004991 [Lobulomyces angularis]
MKTSQSDPRDPNLTKSQLSLLLSGMMVIGEIDFAIHYENEFSLLVPTLFVSTQLGQNFRYYDPDFEQKQPSSGSTNGSVINSLKVGAGSSGYYGNTYHNFEVPKYVNSLVMNTDNSKKGDGRFV